jgi:alkyl hydroperoxide reductase subunit AhpC
MCANSMGGIPYPMLGDFHPHGKVAEAYGVFNADRGTALRSVFIIDKEGVIRYVKMYAPGTLPDPEEALAAIEELGL